MGTDELLKARKECIARYPEEYADALKEIERKERSRFPSRDQVICGYEMGRVCGKGGFGQVRHAIHQDTGDDVVVKYPRPDKYAEYGEKLSEIFRREAGILERLDHPNIVKAYPGFEHNGIPYVAMECIDFSIDVSIQEGNLDEMYNFMRQAVQALKYLHSEGVVHCDVKPHNFMANVDGTIKLADFGSARNIGDRMNLESGITPEYCPEKPEQYITPIENIQALPSRDIYGLGKSIALILLQHTPIRDEELNYSMKRGNEALCLERLRQALVPEYIISSVISRCLDSANDERIDAKDIESRVDTFREVFFFRPRVIHVNKDLYTGQIRKMRVRKQRSEIPAL